MASIYVPVQIYASIPLSQVVPIQSNITGAKVLAFIHSAREALPVPTVGQKTSATSHWGKNVEGSTALEACPREAPQALPPGPQGWNVGAGDQGSEGLPEPGSQALGLQTWPSLRNTGRGSLEHSYGGPSGPGSGHLWFLSMWQ